MVMDLGRSSASEVIRGEVPEGGVLREVEALGFEVEALEIPSGMLGQWALEDEPSGSLRLFYVGCHPGDPDFKVLWVRLGACAVRRAPGGLVSWQTRWAERLWRRNRTFRGLLILTTPGDRARLLSVPFSDGRADRPGLHHVRVLEGEVCAATRERLSRLALKPTDVDGEALATRLKDDLDLRHVTRRFFKDLRRVHARLAQGVRGLSDPNAREAHALRTLNRLIFLYFLQRKRLLDGREDFMRAAVRRVRGSGGGLYKRLLRPLFFGALNTPTERRGAEVDGLGALPYLNGGLFDPSRAERRAGERLDIDDGALVEVFDGLLERYTFTIREDGQGVGVDPEMLGKVFESLMASGKRSATGTFYTPRAVVDRLIEAGLVRLLMSLGVCERGAKGLMGEGRVCPLTPKRAISVRTRLSQVSVLDPACGSGAFLLGALTALERLHRRLAELGGQREPDPQALRRQIIARNLFGVDLSPTAVRLCELRLWLAIVDAAPPGAPIEPLPNLDCRVRQGDALLEPVDWGETGLSLRFLNARVHDLEALKLDYARASSESRPFWRHHLAEAERDLMRALIEARVDQLGTERDALKAAEVAQLPGIEPGDRVRSRRGWLALEEALDGLEKTLEAIDEDDFAPAFSPWIHFPEVMARGGFDFVVTNPPWVRLHGIAPGQRARLRRRYEVLRKGAWTAGGTLRHLKGAGSQVDLSACFVERSLGLMKPNGVLAALLPSKLARALYGGGVRRLLMTEATPTWVAELGGKVFPDATTYPMALVACHTPPTRGATVQMGDPDAQRATPLKALRLDPDDLGSPWVLGEGPGDIGRGAMRLGDHPALRVRRGVMTGFNEAFVAPVSANDGAPGRVPLLRGGDISAWQWAASTTLRWTHDRVRAEPLSELPEDLEAALLPYKTQLEARQGLRRRDPWWRVFRTGPHLYGPKVAWRDIGKHLEAVAIPASGCAGGAAGPVVPLNTVYFIPVASDAQAMVLAAWLNAASVRRYANALGERAAGGYRRFFAWLIELLPLPDALALALRDARSWEASLSVDPDLRALLEHSQTLHRAAEPPADALCAVDEAVASLYERTQRDRGSR